MSGIKFRYSLVALCVAYCFDAFSGLSEELSQLYKYRENTVPWLTRIVSKSEELVSHVHQRNDVPSKDLLMFSENSDDLACKSFSFIDGYTNKEQIDTFRMNLSKISRVLLFLAKGKAQIDGDTAVLSKIKEELQYILEEEGVSEEDISSDCESISSGELTSRSLESEEYSSDSGM